MRKAANSVTTKRLKFLFAASLLVMSVFAGWQLTLNSKLDKSSGTAETHKANQAGAQKQATHTEERKILDQPPTAFSNEDKEALVTVAQLTDYSKQIRAAKPFVPVATSYQGRTQFKFEFPPCGIGMIGYSLNALNSNHKIQYVRHEARGTTYIKEAGPYGFAADIIRYPQTFLNPSVLERFDKYTLNQLDLIRSKNISETSEAIQGDVEGMSVEHMLKIAATWKKLQLITLRDIAITDQSIRYLNDMKSLKAASLGIGSRTKLLSTQPFIKQLTDLSLLRCDANNTLISLSQSKKLNSLYLKNANFSARAMAGLRSCPNLQRLGLELESGFSDEQLNAALSLPYIKKVDISWTPLTKSQVAKIEQINSSKKIITMWNCMRSEDGKDIVKPNARSQIQDNIDIN